MGITQRLAAAVALAFVLTSCGGGQAKVVAKGTPTAPTPSATKVATKAVGPLVELPSGVTFHAPKGWSAISRKTVAGAADDIAKVNGIPEMANRMGMTTEQLMDQIKKLDVFVAAPAATDGFLGNLNAIHVAGNLPSDGTLELQYRGLGAKEITVEVERTDFGPVRVVHYLLPLGAAKIRGGVVALESDGDVVFVTISTNSAKQTDAVLDHVLETLAEK
jgi:hypothetical protein